MRIIGREDIRFLIVFKPLVANERAKRLEQGENVSIPRKPGTSDRRKGSKCRVCQKQEFAFHQTHLYSQPQTIEKPGYGAVPTDVRY